MPSTLWETHKMSQYKNTDTTTRQLLDSLRLPRLKIDEITQQDGYEFIPRTAQLQILDSIHCLTDGINELLESEEI